MLDTLAFQHTLVNGIILSLLLGNIVLSALMVNARLFLKDYPKPIQEKVPPLSPSEKRDRTVLTVLVMGAMLGALILETVQLRQLKAGQVGAFSFGAALGAAYLHVFILLAIFNLFDALVLDLLILTWLKPKCVNLPGAEGLEHLMFDYGKQVRDFLKGMVFCAVASLPFAVAAAL